MLNIHGIFPYSLETIQEIHDVHPFLSRQLNGKQTEIASIHSHIHVGFLVGMDGSDGLVMRSRGMFLGLINLHDQTLAIGSDQFCPCGRSP